MAQMTWLGEQPRQPSTFEQVLGALAPTVGKVSEYMTQRPERLKKAVMDMIEFGKTLPQDKFEIFKNSPAVQKAFADYNMPIETMDVGRTPTGVSGALFGERPGMGGMPIEQTLGVSRALSEMPQPIVPIPPTEKEIAETEKIRVETWEILGKEPAVNRLYSTPVEAMEITSNLSKKYPGTVWTVTTEGEKGYGVTMSQKDWLDYLAKTQETKAAGKRQPLLPLDLTTKDPLLLEKIRTVEDWIKERGEKSAYSPEQIKAITQTLPSEYAVGFEKQIKQILANPITAKEKEKFFGSVKPKGKKK